MVDLILLATLASTAFFVAISFGLLLRYRQVSEKISSSSDLGRDLWLALEGRMKKQDERILDVMGRLEVIQSRITGQLSNQTVPSPVLSLPLATKEVRSSTPTPPTVSAPLVTQVEASHITSDITLDETQVAVLKLLESKPRSSVEIKELTGKSREHSARLMKGLFDAGLVTRDSSKKPFSYQLTESGRRRISST